MTKVVILTTSRLDRAAFEWGRRLFGEAPTMITDIHLAYGHDFFGRAVFVYEEAPEVVIDEVYRNGGRPLLLTDSPSRSRAMGNAQGSQVGG